MRRLILIVCLISSGLLLLSACGFFSPGPGQTVKNFFYAVEGGKIEEAKGMLSAQITATYGAKLPQALAAQSEEIRRKGGIKDIKVNSEDVNGDIANVITTVTFNSENPQTDTTKLIKEDGIWKIAVTK